MTRMGRVTVQAAVLRDALLATNKEITVAIDGKGQVSVHPHADRVQLAQAEPALQAGVVIRKDEGLLHYLRSFKPTTTMAVLPRQRLVGKAHGSSGVSATMRPVALNVQPL